MADADIEQTESFAWDVSRWGQGKGGAGDYFEDIRDNMDPDDGNEIKDALIGEAAVENDLILVTHDDELRDVVNEHTPGSAISVAEFDVRI